MPAKNKKRYYVVEYILHINGTKWVMASNPLRALCKLFALIKFKAKYKHNKKFKRKIVLVKRVSELPKNARK